MSHFERDQVDEGSRLSTDTFAKASPPWTCPLKGKNKKQQKTEKVREIKNAIATAQGPQKEIDRLISLNFIQGENDVLQQNGPNWMGFRACR